MHFLFLIHLAPPLPCCTQESLSRGSTRALGTKQINNCWYFPYVFKLQASLEKNSVSQFQHVKLTSKYSNSTRAHGFRRHKIFTTCWSCWSECRVHVWVQVSSIVKNAQNQEADQECLICFTSFRTGNSHFKWIYLFHFIAWHLCGPLGYSPAVYTRDTFFLGKLWFAKPFQNISSSKFMAEHSVIIKPMWTSLVTCMAVFSF